jgi:hypothetical protein
VRSGLIPCCATEAEHGRSGATRLHQESPRAIDTSSSPACTSGQLRHLADDAQPAFRPRRSTWPGLLGTAAIAAGGGNDVETSTPAEFGAPVKSELIRWKGVVQKAKLTAD